MYNVQPKSRSELQFDKATNTYSFNGQLCLGFIKETTTDGKYMVSKFNKGKLQEETITEKDGKTVTNTVYFNGKKIKQTLTTYLGETKNKTHAEWYENGQKAVEGKSVNDKKVGQWNSWYENGKKKYEVTYVNGKETKVKEWDEKGTLQQSK